MRSLVDPTMPGTGSRAAGPTAATLGVVSIALGISPSDMLSNSRRAPAVYGRHIAMYLLNTIFRMKHTHIGRAFGRDRTTATYACRIIEELRDDPSVEGLLGACEASLMGLKDLAAGRHQGRRAASWLVPLPPKETRNDGPFKRAARSEPGEARG